jgi:pyruvate dehydrogenase E1 component beta subunit
MSKFAWMVGGQTKCPGQRAQGGGGIGRRAQHSQSLSPSSRICPASRCRGVHARRYQGVLSAAIRDDNPVIVLEHKGLLAMEGEVPEGEYVLPIGKAHIIKEGPT